MMKVLEYVFLWFFLFSVLGHRVVYAEEIKPKFQTEFQAELDTETKQEIKLETLKLYARSAVLMDGATGRILYEVSGNEPFPMASTTKIMTCILALENGNLEDLVEISAYAASQPDVQLNAREGERYVLKDLLYSLMLESHNDSAVAVAEHIGGSVEGFAQMMNQKAREIGCYETNFVTPNGLDAADKETGKEHATTAADLAAILRYCIALSPQRENFLEITRTVSHTFSDSTGTHSASCQNHNALLTIMDGALTGKTGFTGKAGYCYVGAVKRDEQTLIVALLGCGWPPHKTYKWVDVRRLMEYGFSNYTYREFETLEEAKLPKIPVEGAKTARIGETAFVGLKLRSEPFGMLMQEKEEVKQVWKLPERLKAPIKAGTPVGVVEYQVNGVTWKTDSVVTESSLEEIDWKWCLEKVWQIACFHKSVPFSYGAGTAK